VCRELTHGDWKKSLITADFVNETFVPTPCGYIEHTLSGVEKSKMKKNDRKAGFPPVWKINYESA
jgi:hypothetical protein